MRVLTLLVYSECSVVQLQRNQAICDIVVVLSSYQSRLPLSVLLSVVSVLHSLSPRDDPGTAAHSCSVSRLASERRQ